MSATRHFDVVVLGAGPGGYTAAVRAAQLGKSVAVVEDGQWGGVCLNIGCIPSKALLRNAEIAHLLQHRRDAFSIVGDAHVDFGGTWKRSRQVADASARGVHYLMKKNGITQIQGWGTLTGPRSISVGGESPDGGGSVEFDRLIIATGATVRSVPGVVPNGQGIVTYQEQILDEILPSSIIIGGSGAIGVEFAYVLNAFGVDVTIIEYVDRMVPTEDADISRELLRQYQKLGIKVLTGTAVTRVDDTGNGVRVVVAPAAGGEEQTLQADRFLAAFGFAPRVDGYGLESTGVALTARRAIAVDGRGRTNVDNVYAIGDVTGRLMLAHVAESMGIVAAETIAGVATLEVDIDMVPRATYCQPQIASFGLTQAQAEEKGHDVRTASFPFSANGKARGLGETVGFVKVVVDAEHHELLGAHLIGPEVTELLPALTLAQQWDLTAEEVGRNIFAHPTLGEAVKEAVHGVLGHAINI